MERVTRRTLFLLDSFIQGFATRQHMQISYYGDLHPPSLDALADFYIECGERLLEGDRSGS